MVFHYGKCAKANTETVLSFANGFQHDVPVLSEQRHPRFEDDMILAPPDRNGSRDFSAFEFFIRDERELFHTTSLSNEYAIPISSHCTDCPLLYRGENRILFLSALAL